MASKCRKFEPNIFNKTKCQNCFSAKEQHSAEALENNKASRKISKCGYLFVAPDYDFSNPLDKSKRWQRRFFVLYDDGELTYSVDENPDTVPQGTIDMNKCTDVKDAEAKTTHSNSMSVITPEKTIYIKANSKEELQWWHDVLLVYPRSMAKPKQRRFTVPSYSFLNKENLQTSSSSNVSAKSNTEETVSKGRFEVEKVKGKDQPFATYRGVRSMKHKTDKHYQEGLRKSSSLHDLTSENKELSDLASSRFLSQSGDGLNTEGPLAYSDGVTLLAGMDNNNPYATLPRRTWQSLAGISNSPAALQLSNGQDSSDHSSTSSLSSQRPGSSDDRSALKTRNASEKSRLHRERSVSLKNFPNHLSLPKISSSVTAISVDRIGHPEQTSVRSDVVDGHASSGGAQAGSQNETDELKMAKSTEMHVNRTTPPPPSPSKTPTSPGTKFEDLMYMKKGWLIKMGTSEKDWKKHWFVLTGNSLRYYKDAKAEEGGSLDGRIDLSSCYDIVELTIPRNYGFRIKTGNGEYVLSAMTSGIRNNWMKAIRLCMDLQSGVKKAGPNAESTPSITSQRTSDDLDLDSSTNSQLLTGNPEKSRPLRDLTKPARRHYSDVNPSNVGKLFSLKDMGNHDVMLSQKSAILSLPAEKHLEQVVANTSESIESQSTSSSKSGNFPSTSSQETFWSSTTGLPMRRYVEGSDSLTSSGQSSESLPKSGGRSGGDKSEDEEERMRRAKSPSTKIKERSRTKTPKLHSPPPEQKEPYNFHMSIPGERVGDDHDSVHSEDMDEEHYDDGHIEDIGATASSGADVTLVDLLENEVVSLKDRLETTQQELVKMHDANRDLTNKLQSVVREKDTSQIPILKRQLKESKDSIQRQKSEIDGLKSKLDMSNSKLTGTEKALSEALKDLKQEKDRFLKASNDWSKKVRTLESQAKEAIHKMERHRDNLMMKEKECRRLENELKADQNKLRDYEREILKLKAVEQEYRQAKERLDDSERHVSTLKIELSEKDVQCKKMESDYEQQLRDMIQEYAKERDDMEHHLEDTKKKLMEAQRKTTISDSLTSDITDIMREKDDIIAQLEEKMIENDRKMVDLTEELNAEVEENSELQHNVEILQKERDSIQKKLKELEKSVSQYQSQITRIEKENAFIRKQTEDLRKENTDLEEKIFVEKGDHSKLLKDRDDLKIDVEELETEVMQLREALSKAEKHGLDKVSSVDREHENTMLHTLVHAESEVNQLSDAVLGMRKTFEMILPQIKEGEQKKKLVVIAEMMEDLGRKCNTVTDILKDGIDVDTIQEHNVKSENSQLLEVVQKEKDALQKNYDEAEDEMKRLRKDHSDLQDKYKKLKKDVDAKEPVNTSELKYKAKLESLNSKIETLASKHKIQLKKKPMVTSKVISEEIEDQLSLLDEKISIIGQVLQSQEPKQAADGQSEDESESDDSEFYSESEEESEEEMESDEDTKDESLMTDVSDNSQLISKLKEMKQQLELTNSKLKDITLDMSDMSDASEKGTEAESFENEGELRKTLIKCGDKIDSLTRRLSEEVRRGKREAPKFSDNTWAFQECLHKIRERMSDIKDLVHEHEELDAKEIKVIQQKLNGLTEYVEHVDSLIESDWEIAGKLAKQESKFQHLLARKEKAARKSTLKYEDKLHLYGDRLAFEAMILIQMAVLVQRQQSGSIYKDILLREIHDVNLQILELQRRVDSTDMHQSINDADKDIVSSYAALLAERIVLEGQIASCAIMPETEMLANAEILSALQVSDSPAILATEIFIRSQLDSSLAQQFKKYAENMDQFSNHIITKAVIQGEITHALQQVKKKFYSQCGNTDDLPLLVSRERKFAFEQLESRRKKILDIVNEYEPMAMTILIQLIEIEKGPGSPTVDVVCNKISSLVLKQAEEFKKALNTSDSVEKAKLQSIVDHIYAEMEDVVAIFKEEYECYVQTASPDIDHKVLRYSVDSVAENLAGITIQKAVLEGSFSVVANLYSQSPDVSEAQFLEKRDGEELQDFIQSLGQILLTEAENKQALAADLRKRGVDREALSGASSRIADLVGVIPDLEAYPQMIDAYTATLVREAMCQAQLTYTTYKLKLQYHGELRDIKLKLEAGQKVELPSEITKETASDIQASLTTFEEILENKYQDESAVLELLESEIKKLRSVSPDQFETQLKKLEKTFQQEVSNSKERQNVHIDVLRQEVNTVVQRVEKFLEEYEKQKAGLVADYEDRIATFQDEFDMLRIDHEHELEQVKQDIMTAVSAIKANEETLESGNPEQEQLLQMQLDAQREEFRRFLEEVLQKIQVADVSEELRERLEAQLHHLRIPSEQTLQQDMSLPTTPQPMGSSTPNIKDLSQVSKGEETLLEEMEKSEDVVAQELSPHKQELEQLKREKEKALADEMRTTKAALDAMRKAYEVDLEQEKERYRHALKTMFTDDYVQEIRHRHEQEVGRLREELKQVKMHYESKTEDYKLLEDRLERTKVDYQQHINQLNSSNEHLTEMLNSEIEKLKQFISSRTTGTVTGSSTIEEELYDAQIMVRVKDTELQKLRNQVKNLENSVERAVEEQRYTMTQYLQQLKKNQELKQRLESESFPQRELKESSQDDDRGVRSLRRAPSFHHRARSPSPEGPSPRKEAEGHHSRDSYRRRHLQPKDLKRSKSSPSIPYVFDGKLGAGGMVLSGSEKTGRDSGGKSSKSSRGSKS
ncbi:hypothetical protein CHS0354_033163 [Potamilus streckersoni]|uniref:PH domain-containing protein n=1 Tax=Potamilus streckersoni TaxID=2493646 RepID=A0AAE0VQA5_9BIVA|nr:hypothetical protein CHS0354_033163 [Potamilus streckersoni]